MTDIGFLPKKVIGPGVQTLVILSAEAVETYGPQLALELEVVGGQHAGHTFTDYASRDENTGKIKQGSKAWTIYEACFGPGFHTRGVSIQDLVSKRFVAKVDKTATGSRNKLEHGTIGPLPSAAGSTPKNSHEPGDGDRDGDGFE